jgi:hypothetical protein
MAQLRQEKPCKVCPILFIPDSDEADQGRSLTDELGFTNEE